jgi:Uma2 family endonuclease
MAVQFAQPYRFSEQQLARMAQAGVVPEHGTELIDGVPYWAATPFRFSGEEYSRLGELGVLCGEDRVELIDGEVIAMNPEGSRHFACVARLIRFLTPRVGEALLTAKGSLSLPDQTWPMPDVMVLRPSEHDYESGNPTREDALVVIEVSDTTLAFDRNVKSVRYAEGSIPEYWMVDLTRDKIVIHQQPAAGAYRNVRMYGRGERWTSSVLGGLSVPVDVILKPR